jgi:hypothetical protein
MRTEFWSEKLNRNDYLQDLVVDGKIIVNRSYRNRVERCTGFTVLRIGTREGGSCETITNILVP